MPNPRTFYKHRTQSSKLFAPTSNIRFASPLKRPISPFRAQYGLGTPYLALSGSIRAFGRPISLTLNTGLGRPISLTLNTGFWAPYFANAQYGLGAPYFANAQYGLLGGYWREANTPPLLPGVALRLPRAVFWRPFRALAWVVIRLPRPRGCTSFTPGCILATLQGARS